MLRRSCSKQKQTKGRPKADQRQNKGRPKADQRQTKGSEAHEKDDDKGQNRADGNIRTGAETMGKARKGKFNERP